MKPRLFDLSGKVAIVTGGNGGIGLGMARGLADVGCAVAIVGRNQAKSDAIRKSGNRFSLATNAEIVLKQRPITVPASAHVRDARRSRQGARPWPEAMEWH
jgi:NAD(P)-dependent dehydrogenase (short-subunit alcohol dehydrogenase family)